MAKNERDLADDLIQLEKSEDFFFVIRNKYMLPLVKKQPVFDVGCGTGVVTKPLLKKGMDVYSLDIDPRLCKMTKRYSKKVYCMDFNRLDEKKFPKFGTIIMGDVIEHIHDDIGSLRKANILLRDKGHLIISVPYHSFLWTKNDELRGHKRRYSKKELRAKLKKAGFRVKKFVMWSMLSIPPLLIAKIFSKRVPHEVISNSKLNSMLIWYFKNIEYNLPLPIGSGIICVAEKIPTKTHTRLRR